MEDHDLSVDLLVTDRHRQIEKWLKTDQPDITHKYDVWHVAKCKLLHLFLNKATFADSIQEDGDEGGQTKRM